MKKIIIIFILFGTFIQCQSQNNSKMMKPTIDNKFETITKKVDNGREDEIIGKDHFIYTSAKIGFGEVRFNEDSYFSVIKNFYPSKMIQNKGISFTEGSGIGIWFHYNEAGKLIKEENTEEGYDFKPEQVIAYCEKNKIKLPRGYQSSGFHTKILKERFEGNKVWKITHQIAGDQIEEITLDGKNGKEIKRMKAPFINN